jgi:hypothetical protein
MMPRWRTTDRGCWIFVWLLFVGGTVLVWWLAAGVMQ